MKKLTPLAIQPVAAVMMPQLFARWRKDPWPMPTGLHLSLDGQQARKAEYVAARQEWEDEGGTVKPPMADGPKLPL